MFDWAWLQCGMWFYMKHDLGLAKVEWLLRKMFRNFSFFFGRWLISTTSRLIDASFAAAANSYAERVHRNPATRGRGGASGAPPRSWSGAWWKFRRALFWSPSLQPSSPPTHPQICGRVRPHSAGSSQLVKTTDLFSNNTNKMLTPIKSESVSDRRIEKIN